MAINKKLIHFKTFENFNSKKLSANEENTQYTIGIDGAVTDGEPDVKYQSICWIKDVQKIWTHSTIYNCADLISGTNIKTINGESLLGEGDIIISSESNSSRGAYALVEHDVNDTTYTLTPNTFHIWEEVTELSLTLADPTDTTVANEYVFQFTSGATATTLTLPDTIKWANDAPPTIVENMIYQVSILNGLAGVLEFNNAAPVVLITFYYNGSPSSAEEGMTWEQWCNSTYNNTILGIYGNMVMVNGMYNVRNSSGMQVYGTDVIIENEYYVIISEGIGGSGGSD